MPNLQVPTVRPATPDSDDSLSDFDLPGIIWIPNVTPPASPPENVRSFNGVVVFTHLPGT